MRRRVIFFCTILSACGGSAGPSLDGAVPPDGSAGDGGPPPCDYSETSDQDNGLAAEPTAIVLDGTRASICGMVQPKPSGDRTVDVDRFALASNGARQVLVRITAPGAAVEKLRLVVSSKGSELGVARFLVSHGVLVAAVPDGSVELTVDASAAPAAGPFAYRLDVSEADPVALCPALTEAADYDEADESAESYRANDVIAVRATGNFPRALTSNTGDAPEATGLVLSESTETVLAGSSADVTTIGDDYLDRDTFLIATGSKVNQLTLRLNWEGTGTDLDVMLFPAGDLEEVVAGNVTALSEDELEITAVEPSSSYWLWIGAFGGSTDLPKDYRLSICAAEHRPVF